MGVRLIDTKTGKVYGSKDDEFSRAFNAAMREQEEKKGITLVDRVTGKVYGSGGQSSGMSFTDWSNQRAGKTPTAAASDPLMKLAQETVAAEAARKDNHDVLHSIVQPTATNSNPAADMYGTGAVTTPKIPKPVDMHGVYIGPEAPQVAELTRLRDQRNNGSAAYASGDPNEAMAQWERQKAIDARIAELEEELTAAGLDVRTDFQRATGLGQQKQTSPVDAQRKITNDAFRTANAFMPLESGAWINSPEQYDTYKDLYDKAAMEEQKLHDMGANSGRELPLTTAKNLAAGTVGAARGLVNEAGYVAQGATKAQMDENAEMWRRMGREDYAQDMQAAKDAQGEMQSWAQFGQPFLNSVAEESSRYGKVGRALGNVAQGVGGMVPSILSNLIVPGSGLPVMFLQASGNATEEAKAAGASDEAAALYGTAVGGVEVLTEKMFGGIPGLGVGALDEGVENIVKAKVGNAAAQRALLLFIDAMGEGVEEFTSEFGDYFLNRWLVGDDKRNLAQLNKDALYSALIGALTSVAMQVPANLLGNSASRKELAHQVADTVGNTYTKDAGMVGNSGQMYVNQYAQSVLKSGDMSPDGVSALVGNYKGGTNAADYVDGIVKAYSAGLKGTDMQRVIAPDLTEQQVKAAYDAGVAEAKRTAPAQKAQEVTPTQQAQEVKSTSTEQMPTTQPSAPGLVSDETAAKAKLTRQEARQLDALGKLLGVEVRFADRIESGEGAAANRGGVTQGKYENGRITLALDAEDPFMTTAVHETIHRIRDLSPESYDALQKFVTRNMSEANLAADQAVKEGNYPAGADLTEETVADAFGRMIGDPKLLNQFVTDNRTAAQKVFDALHDLLVKVQRALTGDSRKLTADQKAVYGDLQEKLNTMLSLYGEALGRASEVQEAQAAENGARASISEGPDGKKYVKADRQVIYGNDPDAWSEQLEGYINGKIRRGQDVTLITEDGEPVTLTATSAGKLADNHRSNGTSLTDSEFERKVNAATHIDELMEVSSNRDGAPKVDRDGRHGDMAADGWTYNTAYFEDFDGKYYRVKVSVAHGPNGNMVYNIGDMQERSPAKITGSSAQGGALNGGTSSNTSIRENSTKSNTHSSMSERELLAEYVKRYGALDKGDAPARDISLPARTADKTKLSMTARTVAEAGATPEEFIPNIENMAARGEFDYTPESDEAAIKTAKKTLEKDGWDETLAKWEKDIGKGKVSKANTAMGWALYDAAANTGKTETALQILRDIVQHQRNAAQATQAGRILKQLNPDTQLYNAEKTVDDLQRELRDRYGDRAPDLQIDPDLADQFLRAKTQEERDKVMGEIYRDIGRQMPTTFRERWNAWRYLAMLGNPRTHIRNIAGNLFFAPVVAAKDLTATAIEGIVSKATGGQMERTKGNIIGRGDLLKAAYGDYVNIEAEALGEGKYTDRVATNKQIEEGHRVFGNTRSQAWNKTGGAALEALRRGNGTLLDKEDVVFSRPHYALALAQYCAANNISAEQISKGQGLAKARAYAIKEAQKATYRDTNDFSEFVSKLGRFRGMENSKTAKAVGLVTEGILPFRKTPANILARGVEYSPAGLLKSLTVDMAKLKQGKITASELIDNISAGLTGTGLAGLGALMVKLGFLRGYGGSDDKEKDYKDLTGHQQYALELPGGTSITLDWMAPEALPFFVGANIMELAMEKKDGVKMADVLTAIKSIGEPMLEMSCLQSLNNALDNISYAKNSGKSPLVSFLSGAATSYLTQAIPTLFGQIERTAETKRMTTYTDKNKFLTTDAQYTLGKATSRIPGLDYSQIPYIDAWGREELTGGFLQRAGHNFFNPAYTSRVKESDMEKELERLYQETGKDVFPDRAAKSFTVNGEEKSLTGEEYVKYATDKGRTAYTVVGNMVETSAYKGMTDAEKVAAVKSAYEYANQTAKSEFGYTPDKWVQNAKNGVTRGIPVASYITTKTAVAGISSLKDKNGDTIRTSEDLQVMEYIYSLHGLTDDQRQYLFGCFNVGKSVIGYNKAKVAEKLAEMRKQSGGTTAKSTTPAAEKEPVSEVEIADQSGSSVWSVSYDRKAQTATVKWSENGKAYTYDGISAEDWQAYLDAPSKGGYINAHWK